MSRRYKFSCSLVGSFSRAYIEGCSNPNKVEMIKWWRSSAGVGLRQAKLAIEEMMTSGIVEFTGTIDIIACLILVRINEQRVFHIDVASIEYVDDDFHHLS